MRKICKLNPYSLFILFMIKTSQSFLIKPETDFRQTKLVLKVGYKLACIHFCGHCYHKGGSDSLKNSIFSTQTFGNNNSTIILLGKQGGWGLCQPESVYQPFGKRDFFLSLMFHQGLFMKHNYVVLNYYETFLFCNVLWQKSCCQLVELNPAVELNLAV